MCFCVHLKANQKGKTSLINDRRSFYDNHKWTNDDDANGEHAITTTVFNKTTVTNGSEQVSHRKPLMLMTGGCEKSSKEGESVDSPKLFKSERCINLNGQKHERDDFDDLVDLTHRAPRKLLKKDAASSNECLPAYMAHSGTTSAAIGNGAGVGRKCSSANKLSSSLPPLPPLPYSFVKLEKYVFFIEFYKLSVQNILIYKTGRHHKTKSRNI